MINPKEKRIIQKFQFKKEVVSTLNNNELNSVLGGANTLEPSSVILICSPKGYSRILGCGGATKATVCQCSSATNEPCL